MLHTDSEDLDPSKVVSEDLDTSLFLEGVMRTLILHCTSNVISEDLDTSR
jgi:hypothetical protein